MTKDNDEEIAELERLNAELAGSLRRCRRILADCRSRLASNSNTPEEPDAEAVGG